MFTGIVETVGTLLETGAKMRVKGALGKLDLGSSVSVNGVCLTVTSSDEGSFRADLSEETLSRTTFSQLQPGDRVNLERPMLADGRFGGHLVQGHVDGTGRVVHIDRLEGSSEVHVAAPHELLTACVPKGSITMDGVSLTIAALEDDSLVVSLIPHTLNVTILGGWREGTLVNIETDIIARYVQRLMDVYPSPRKET